MIISFIRITKQLILCELYKENLHTDLRKNGLFAMQCIPTENGSRKIVVVSVPFHVYLVLSFSNAATHGATEQRRRITF